MKKKFALILFAIMVTGVLCLSLIACNEKETKEPEPTVDVVVVSDKCDTEVDAVKKYVEDELTYYSTYISMAPGTDGSPVITEESKEKMVDAAYVGYEVKNSADIKDFKLTDEQKAGVTAIEKVSIAAKITNVEKIFEIPANYYKDVEIKQTAYLVKYDDNKFSYLTSSPEVGERLTNGYIKSLTDSEKYKTLEWSYSQEDADKNGVLQFNYGHVCKIGETALLMCDYTDKERLENRTPKFSGNDIDETDEEYMYLPQGDKIVAAGRDLRSAGEWKKWDDDTPDGTFAEYKNDLFNNTYETGITGEAKMTPVLYVVTETGAKFSTEYQGEGNSYELIITDGKLASLIWAQKDTETDVTMRKMTQTFSGWGETTVEIPAEVQAFLE